MSDKIDNVIAYFCNMIIRTFASKRYNANLDKVIAVGMNVLDAAVIQEKKTPGEPYGIQIGFNGLTPISTLARDPETTNFFKTNNTSLKSKQDVTNAQKGLS